MIIKDNKVLLVQDEKDDHWTFPGGGVDAGESLKIAMIRELIEEIDVNENDISGDFMVAGIIIGHMKEGIPRCNIHFKINLANSVNISTTNETQEIEWIAISELDKTIFDPSAGPKQELITLIKRLA